MDDVFYIIAAIPMWKVITSTSSWLSDHLIRLFNIFFSNFSSNIVSYRTIIETNFNREYKKIRVGFFGILIFYSNIERII